MGYVRGAKNVRSTKGAIGMNKKLAELTVTKSKDYNNKVVKALEDAGFVLVINCETTFETHYIVAERMD